MDGELRTNTILKLQMLVIASIMCGAILVKMQGCGDISSSGPLSDLSDWPRPIQDFYASLNEAGVNTKTFRVFLLHSGIDESCVCRMDVDDAGWEVIRQNLELEAVRESKANYVRRSIVSVADSSWWPTRTDNAEYFASAPLLAGDEGDLYVVARNAESGQVYVHYRFNFD